MCDARLFASNQRWRNTASGSRKLATLAVAEAHTQKTCKWFNHRTLPKIRSTSCDKFNLLKHQIYYAASRTLMTSNENSKNTKRILRDVWRDWLSGCHSNNFKLIIFRRIVFYSYMWMFCAMFWCSMAAWHDRHRSKSKKKKKWFIIALWWWYFYLRLCSVSFCRIYWLVLGDGMMEKWQTICLPSESNGIMRQRLSSAISQR